MTQRNEEVEVEEEELSIEKNENICIKFLTFLLGFESLGFELFQFSIVNVYVTVWCVSVFLVWTQTKSSIYLFSLVFFPKRKVKKRPE